MTDAKFKELITGSGDLARASLATRILISRLRIEARAQPATLAEKVTELRAFVAKNDFAKTDLERC